MHNTSKRKFMALQLRITNVISGDIGSAHSFQPNMTKSVACCALADWQQ